MKMMKKVTLAAFAGMMTLGAMALPAAASDHSSHGPIEVDDAWARARAATAKVAGAFMEIENKSAEDDRLVSATSDISERVEIHTTKMEDGVMRMMQMKEGIVIPAGGEVELKPGGYHVMFLGLKTKLEEGTMFPVMLKFEKAGDVKVMVHVKASGAMGEGHGNMKHDKMDHGDMKHDGIKKMKSN
jgi:copper(I)-binding protein